jgi:hypothetical protein
MIGDEARVVAAFCAWLSASGWHYQREVNFVDVVADRAGRRVYAEAKGRTSSTGLDIDTLYGQLLRRMPASQVGEAVFAVVVADSAVSAAERVPARVRELLGIEVYGVGADGAVHHVGPSRDPLA